MALKLIVPVFLAFAVIAEGSLGDLRLLSRSRFLFQNTGCALNSTCSLKNINYLVEDYSIEIDKGLHYGTRMYSMYETGSVADLTDYVFVQFIKGCVYRSSPSLIGFEYVQVVDSGRDSEVMKYPDWVTDSGDNDPVYNSTEGFERHHLYRWNQKLNSFDTRTENLYGNIKPNIPRLYVADHPGTAFEIAIGNDGAIEAKNISLAFRTCLYKSSDVPKNLSRKSIDFAEPINCFEWYSSWIYDHSQNKFTQPYGISSVCK